MYDLILKGEPKKSLIPHLQNFNEEISDAIHFWAELMIFSGFESEKMAEWAKLMGHDNPDIMTAWFEIGIKSYLDITITSINPDTYWETVEILPDGDPNLFLKGGRLLNTLDMVKMQQILWEITYNLQIARNTLKNKPWKQTGVMTDEHMYEKHMKMATAALFTFLWFVGLDQESTYHIYFKKNKVNQFRIKSQY